MEKASRKVKVLGLCFMCFSLLTFFIAAHPASAAVINSPDVAGFKTFQDLATGRIWLDLNNFYNFTFNQMKTSVESAGFTVADYNDVNQLLSTLPDPSANWASYITIMGMAPYRSVIWGGYTNNSQPNYASWASAFDYNTTWIFNEQTTSYGNNDTVLNGGSRYCDMNIWAYKTVVPLPSALFLFAPGLAGLAAIRRRFIIK